MKAKILIIILLVILIGGLILMGIFHDRVVASRDKGMAEDWNADHKIQGNVDFRSYAAENMLIESVVAWPPGPPEGQIIWRSDLNQGYIFDGTNWVLYTLNSKTSYYSLPGVAFIQQEFDALNENLYDEGEGTLFFRKTTGTIAPVNLPHGAVVTKVWAYGNFGNWALIRKDLAGNNFDIMAMGAGQGSDATIDQATIDNQNYTYFFSIYGTNNISNISSVMIEYTTIYI